MSAVTVELIESNFEAIIEKVGSESFVPWEEFTKNSTAVVNAIDSLTKWLAIFREMQHKNFIQTMKNLKSLDVPDSIESVRKKKLPKQVLKPLLKRFSLNQTTKALELNQSKEELKGEALKEFQAYMTKNEHLVNEVNKYIDFFALKSKEAGFEPQKQAPNVNHKPQVVSAEQQPSQSPMTKATMEIKFDEKDNELFENIAKGIKVKFLAGSDKKFVDGTTYCEIVEKTFDCIGNKFAEVTFEARKEQRKNMNNPQQYYKNIDSYFANTETLVLEGVRNLYEKCGMDRKVLEANEQQLVEENMGQMMMMTQAGLRQKLKSALPIKKDVSVKEAVETIKYQIELMTTKRAQIKSYLKPMKKGVEAAQIVPLFLSLILNDFIYEKYGWQEEEYMKNIGKAEMMNDPSLMEVFGQMEGAIMSLMQDLEIIPKDIGQMMMGPQGEEMARMMQEMMGGGMDMEQMGQMMGQMMSQQMQQGQGQVQGQPQGQVPQNPMELLQMQQQFQDMMMGQQQPKKDQDNKKDHTL